MGGQELLLGVGDSSFSQLPHPSALSSRPVDGSSRTEDRSAWVRKISCGVTASFAVSSQGSLLEWGTGMYGERLSPTAKVSSGDDASTAAQTPPLDRPVVVFFPFPVPPVVGAKPPAIKLIACGAHFVVAALETGGCVSWGGGRDARRALGRGGCGTCSSCSSSPSAPVAPSLKQQSCPSGSGKPEWVAEPLGLGGLAVADLAAGDNHAIAVCEDGKAWAWGSGECGQLGSGAPPERAGAGGGGACVPVSVRVPPTAMVRAAACGRDHSAVLTSDGRVWTFGSSLHGQLGLGNIGERSWTPAVVDALDGVGTMRMDGSFTGMASVACGAWHTAALSTTGDVYAWGWARFGALGPSPSNELSRGSGAHPGGSGGGGRGEEVDRPSDAGADVFSGCKRKTAVESEEGEVRPYPGLVDGIDALLSDDDQLVSVACGARYTLALSGKKRAFVWGQVAPPAGNSGAGAGPQGKRTGPLCGSSLNKRGRGAGGGNAPLCGSFATPRELRPEELLRAVAVAGAPARSAEGVDGTGRPCSNENTGVATFASKAEVAPRGQPVVQSDDDDHDSGSRWRISTAGCGPWYIVLGLEEKDRQENEGRAVRKVGSMGSGLLA